MDTCSVVRSYCPAKLFSFGLLDGLQVRLRRPYVREASADFRLERLTTAFMNNPGGQDGEKAAGFVLASLRGSTYRKGTLSLLTLLRPRWTTFLSILTSLVFIHLVELK